MAGPAASGASTGGSSATGWRIGCVAAVILAVVAAFVLLRPSEPAGMTIDRDRICEMNIAQLAELAGATRREELGVRRGPAMLLAWRAQRTRIMRGQEAVLLCPCDPVARPPEGWGEADLWDLADLDHPSPRLCSYAVRDFARFPAEESGGRPEPAIACPHHGPDVVFLGFTDGTAKRLDHAALGIAEGAPLTIGPGSASPILRMFLTAADAPR